ncbi:hypothetical protein ACFP3U_17760 [Kitasatospora misakiensis]|uniref:Uncharacterized protein n=1 Tax=Kitasatospora misakiensis TaxID=67330 RepID=A0ABW0X6H3_9ACTN
MKAALAEHQAKKQKVDVLIAEYYGENPDGLSREQFVLAKASAEASLQACDRTVEKLSTKHSMVTVPAGTALREAWARTPDLGWRRQIVGLALDKVIVHPGGGKYCYKRWIFDSSKIEITWKV